MSKVLHNIVKERSENITVTEENVIAEVMPR